MKRINYFLTIIALIFISCNSNTGPGRESTAASSKDSVVAIAKKAFIYGVPLFVMDITRKKVTNTTNVTSDKAPINQLAIAVRVPDASFTDVVRPNADTYYHQGFLDLTKDALVLTVPNTNGRYYLLPMLDAYTNVFASPGKRTTGTKADTFLITGPGWSGTAPTGMKQFKAPTNMVWFLGRIQVNNQKDGDNVVIPIEKKINLTPLASWGKPYTAPSGTVDSSLSKASPNEQLEKAGIEEYFNYVNELMVANPPAAADAEAMASFATIGVGPGLKFDLGKFDTATQAALKAIPGEVVAYVNEILSSGKMVKPVNNWTVAYKGFGNYGTDYDLRALVDYAGLGANLPEDAVYPQSVFDSAGERYDGANNYVMHFAKGETPPVHGFWSLTMYNEAGFFIANPINRFAIGNRNPLKYNADSSLDLYFQNLSPGKAKENNWLPAPKGIFNLTLRLYWPAEKFLEGNWTPPAVMKTK
jgi:DNA sulfur modification protein DndE